MLLMKPLAYTHSGDFHIDELVAMALLQAFVFPEVPLEVVRTRDPGKLTQAQADPGVFVVDVGREYNPATLNFDHHQPSMTEGWEDGTPYSSCGLVWHWLKEQGFLEDLAPRVQEMMEKDLIYPIDQHDNGLSKWPMASLFRLYNRTAGSEPEIQKQFERAWEMAKDLVINQRHQAQVDFRAESELTKFWQESQELGTKGIVWVRSNLENRSSHSILARVSDYRANLMVYPQNTSKNNRGWFIRSLPDRADSHENRVLFPTEWRGLEKTQLSLPEGPVEVQFVHKNGFLARVNGGFREALALANAVLHHPENRHALNPNAPGRAPGLR